MADSSTLVDLIRLQAPLFVEAAVKDFKKLMEVEIRARLQVAIAHAFVERAVRVLVLGLGSVPVDVGPDLLGALPKASYCRP